MQETCMKSKESGRDKKNVPCMREDLQGRDHSETLDAARRPQNVGQEFDDDDDAEQGEVEDLGVLQQ